MPLSIKDGATWKEPSKLWVKDGGVWKEAKEGYVKDGGVWKKAWPAKPARLIGALTVDGRGTFRFPATWNPSDNFIECYGSGGKSGGSSGGGGGAYARIDNFGQPNQSYYWQVGRSVDSPSMNIQDPDAGYLIGPQHTAIWTDNYDYVNDRFGYIFHCLAQGGQSTNSTGAAGTGGQAANGVGAVRYSGGNGCTGGDPGGGGCAGPNGNGSNGVPGAGGAGNGGTVPGGANGDLYMPTHYGSNWYEYDPAQGKVGPSGGARSSDYIDAGGGSGGGGRAGTGLIVFSYKPL